MSGKQFKAPTQKQVRKTEERKGRNYDKRYDKQVKRRERALLGSSGPAGAAVSLIEGDTIEACKVKKLTKPVFERKVCNRVALMKEADRILARASRNAGKAKIKGTAR